MERVRENPRLAIGEFLTRPNESGIKRNLDNDIYKKKDFRKRRKRLSSGTVGVHIEIFLIIERYEKMLLKYRLII